MICLTSESSIALPFNLSRPRRSAVQSTALRWRGLCAWGKEARGQSTCFPARKEMRMERGLPSRLEGSTLGIKLNRQANCSTDKRMAVKNVLPP